MSQWIKYVLCVIYVSMAFTAQVSRADDKKEQQDHSSRPQEQTSREVSHNDQKRPEAPSRREAPQQVAHRESAPVQERTAQRSYHEANGPRVYAVPEAVPVENNNLFHQQHHKHWQPMYNFYDGQYHFYPYVNVASTVEFSPNVVSVLFNGQSYYYDLGAFYLRDADGQYEAVVPPVGITVNLLPAWAKQVEVGDQTYYRCKGAFYLAVPQGYQAVEVPQGVPDNS